MAWKRYATNLSPIFQTACARACNRVSSILYKSRIPFTVYDVQDAFSWLMFPIYEGATEVQYEIDTQVRVKSYVLPKDVPIEETTNQFVNNYIVGDSRNRSRRHVIIINTSTNKALEEQICAKLDALTQRERVPRESYYQISTIPVPALTLTPIHRVRCYDKVYINTENEIFVTNIILTNLYGTEICSRISAALLAQCSRYKNFINDDELFATLVKGYAEADAEIINNCVHQIYDAKLNELNAARMAEAIKTITTLATKDVLSSAERAVNEASRNLNNYEEEYKNALNKLRSAQLNLLEAMTLGTTEREQQVKDFLTSISPNITYLQKGEQNNILLSYKTPLLYFEPKHMELMLNSDRTNPCNSTHPAIRNLLKEVFMDKTYQLIFDTGVDIDLRYNDIYFWTPPTNVVLQGIPNPHHKYYNCWGDNKPYIKKALVSHDVVAAITQIIAAFSGMNLTDTAVVRRFVEEELMTDSYRRIPCLKNLATGELLNIEQYCNNYTAAQEANNA